MADVELIVSGRKYGGWKTIRITRTIESIAGSFSLGVSDRWGIEQESWPIREEDSCRIDIDGETVLDGFVDKRKITISPQARTLQYDGKDKAAALVESSALVSTFKNANVLTICRKVAEPHGINVTVQAGLTLPRAERKIAVNPGDTGYAVMQRAAKAAGVLLVSDSGGGLIISRSGTDRVSTRLVEGQNLKHGGVDYDGTNTFHRYIIATQRSGTNSASGEATRIKGEAFDDNVRRKDRVLWIPPEAGLSKQDAGARADWEARTRAGSSVVVSVTVRNWKQADDTLWPLNKLVFVQSPSLGISGDLLITEIEHALDEQGEVTGLRLMRSDAFTPEPQKRRVSSRGKASGAYEERPEGV